MKKIFIIITAIFLFSVTAVFADDNKTNTSTVITKKFFTKQTIHKNKYFSVTMPEEVKGTYCTNIKKDRISIYDKASKKAGFGGFAFGIKVYKNPSEHATLPGGKKMGELVDKKGILYDVVLKYPTDVQFDYTKNQNAPNSYKLLYELGENINIQGTNGSKYYKGQGMHGKDLYKDVLEKYKSELLKKPDSQTLENKEMSYMYNVLAQNSVNSLEKVGYAYYDVNADGIDELFIGEIADGKWKGVVYDIYTMVNRKPLHVISGGARNRYFVCDTSFICNEYSAGANENGIRVYALLENSTELYPQVSFKYDGYANPNNPWFISYGSEINNDQWENVDIKKYTERKKIFERYERFEYTPLKNFVYNE